MMTLRRRSKPHGDGKSLSGGGISMLAGRHGGMWIASIILQRVVLQLPRTSLLQQHQQESPQLPCKGPMWPAGPVRLGLIFLSPPTAWLAGRGVLPMGHRVSLMQLVAVTDSSLPSARSAWQRALAASQPNPTASANPHPPSPPSPSARHQGCVRGWQPTRDQHHILEHQWAGGNQA